MKKFKFEKSFSEEEKRYNPNNKGIISVFRHGETTPEGELAPKGFEQAGEIAQKTEKVGTVAKDYGSTTQRAQDMSREMIDKLVDGKPKDPIMGEDQYKSRVREGLSFLEKGQESQWFTENWSILTEQGPSKPIETYLSFGEKRPDKTTLAPKEMASRVSKVLYDQIEKDPINPQGKTLIEKMGGCFKKADGFEIHVKTDENGKLSADLNFRGKNYNIDMNELKELSEFYKTGE